MITTDEILDILENSRLIAESENPLIGWNKELTKIFNQFKEDDKYIDYHLELAISKAKNRNEVIELLLNDYIRRFYLSEDLPVPSEIDECYFKINL